MKLQAFTVNDSERIDGGVCFQLQTVTGLLLVKLQIFTINSCEGFCDRMCNEICHQLQNMKDLCLEKVQAFTTNSLFGKSVTS